MLTRKPLTPHLTVYKAENSSLYSIWHRIASIITILLLFLTVLLIKFFTWGISLHNFVAINSKYLTFIFLVVVIYHMLNGCRHIFWDLNKHLSSHSVIMSSYLLVSIFFMYLFTWLLSL